MSIRKNKYFQKIEFKPNSTLQNQFVKWGLYLLISWKFIFISSQCEISNTPLSSQDIYISSM